MMHISEKQLEYLIKLVQCLLMEEGKNHVNQTAESILEMLYEIKNPTKFIVKKTI